MDAMFYKKQEDNHKIVGSSYNSHFNYKKCQEGFKNDLKFKAFIQVSALKI